jgi:nitrogen fixation protein FixH
VAHTRSVKREISVRYAAGEIDIALPAGHARQGPTGSIQLYRPSDASLDQNVALAVGKDGDQKIDATKLRPGLWKVRITWKVGAEEFFFDQSIVVGA